MPLLLTKYFNLSLFKSVTLIIICFRLIIAYTEDKNNPSGKWRGYVLSISVFAVALTQSIALQQYFHIVFTLGMKIRTAVIGMVYEKVMAQCRLN